MATHSLPLVPFELPREVYLEMPPGLKQDGIRGRPSIKIEDLPRATVQQLCSEFQSALLNRWDHANEARERAPVRHTREMKQ